MDRIYEDYEPAEFLIPYEDGRTLSYFMENAHVTDKEYQENTSVFPDTSTLTNSEVYQYLGTEADDLYSALWKEIKSH